MQDPAEPLRAIHAVHVKLTGRESRYQVYERSLYDFVQAGFTAEDMEIVLAFMLRENKRNDWKYSLQLGKLLGDHERFQDLLSDAKARLRNMKKMPTPKEVAIEQLRPVVVEPLPAATGRTIGEVFRTMGQS